MKDMRDMVIRNLYPSVVSINAGVDATDQSGEVVVLDEVAIATEIARITPLQHWKESIQATDSGMPRYLEDHITDGHDGDAGNEFLQVKYDAKITLRATKP